jgi:hypothetical protein
VALIENSPHWFFCPLLVRREIPDNDKLEVSELNVGLSVKRDAFNAMDACRPYQLVGIIGPEIDRLDQVKPVILISEGNFDLLLEAGDFEFDIPYEFASEPRSGQEISEHPLEASRGLGAFPKRDDILEQSFQILDGLSNGHRSRLRDLDRITPTQRERFEVLKASEVLPLDLQPLLDTQLVRIDPGPVKALLAEELLDSRVVVREPDFEEVPIGTIENHANVR